MDWRAFTVEVIRQLWDRGLYRDNPWLRRCHDNWIGFWIDWKTSLTMKAVNRQLKKLNPEPVKMIEPTFEETLEGDTLLGGPMRLHHEFTDDNNT